jgi:hypothetical protein
MRESDKKRIIDALEPIIGEKEGQISDWEAINILEKVRKIRCEPEFGQLDDRSEEKPLRESQTNDPSPSVWKKLAIRAKETRAKHLNDKFFDAETMEIALQNVADGYQQIIADKPTNGPRESFSDGITAMLSAKKALRNILFNPACMASMAVLENGTLPEVRHTALLGTHRFVTPVRLVHVTIADADVLIRHFEKAVKLVAKNRPISPKTMLRFGLAFVWRVGFGRSPVSLKAGGDYGPEGEAWRDWLLEALPVITNEKLRGSPEAARRNLDLILDTAIRRNPAVWLGRSASQETGDPTKDNQT